jgi:coniferyl-aldehyde dehydrogenase
LRATLAEAFTDDEVCVFGGDASVGCEFAGLRLDHLIFTGSTYVGRLVMETASKSLTPVTLELGGKSPAVVSRSGSIEDAAAKIAHGKSFNCGQICIAPDYALVPREHVDRFVAALQAHFRKMHPRGSVADPDYSNIVSPIHAARIFRLIEEASARGARVVACEDGGSGQRIPLHIILDPTDEMTVMQEEIFGPVLPIVPYDKIEEAIAYIAGRARPLALYWFGRDESELRQTLNGTHSGGVVINDWGWHVFQNDLPFGGIGASGTGSYHGVEGFHALSHARSVFRERSWFPVKWFHPPYGNLAQRLSVRIYLGPQNSSSGPKS